jgi:hypothetical protein
MQIFKLYPGHWLWNIFALPFFFSLFSFLAVDSIYLTEQLLITQKWLCNVECNQDSACGNLQQKISFRTAGLPMGNVTRSFLLLNPLQVSSTLQIVVALLTLAEFTKWDICLRHILHDLICLLFVIVLRDSRQQYCWRWIWKLQQNGTNVK